MKFSLNYFKDNWQLLLSVASISSLVIHYFAKFALKIDENYSLFFVLIVGGIPLLIQIFLKIIKGNLGADLIAFMALILAIYLQENVAGVLIILMLASSQALEEFASHRASFVLEALAQRMPTIAHLKSENNFFDTEISKIKINDLIAVFPHEICPIDGEVVEGRGSMDESYLTGEPYRISKTIGSKVLSGAVNGESLFVIKTEKLPADSRYGKIMEVMKKAKEQKPEIRKLADKIGAIFAPVTIIISSTSYYFTHDLTNFLAVLTIATPCPLLIAVPIAIISAISISARQGIIIKDARILEKLSICTTAIFDKTGTLTYGEPNISEIIALDEFSADEILQKTASLERYSRHPLAGSILKEAQKRNLILLDAQNISEKPGYGMIGNIGEQEIIITSRKKIHEFQPSKIPLPDLSDGMECVIIINKKVAGILHFRDLERPESKSFISHLAPNHNFKKIILLSGDRASEVNYLAEKLGINNYFSSQSPEQKLEIVKRETQNAPTLFMGDGINDAPALMLASVGIAFGQGNNITSESSGAVILESNLLKVDELIHISIFTRKIILQSAIGGMVFSVVGMILASFGLISPAEGAIIQQIIDAIAIVNALRLTIIKNVASDIN
jgi:heavy metal translocating P-type ATPase